MRRATWSSIAVVVPSVAAIAINGCAVFDDDMRQGDPGPVAADGRDGNGSTLPADPTCTLDVPAGIGAGGCGGKGGQLLLEGVQEREDNGQTPNPVVLDKPICGALRDGDDADRFALAVEAGDCVELYLTGEGVSGVVEGPGQNRLSFTGTSTMPIEVGTRGTITITFTSTSTTNHYAFIVRR